AEVRTILTEIVNEGHRAGDILTSVRATFRKERHEGLPLNVNDLVRDVLTLAHGDLEHHRIAMQIGLSEGLPDIVGERVPLQQVLLNLIMNAVEAMGAVTDRPRVLSVMTQVPDRNGVLIAVADAGTGIEPQNMNRIFEAFFTTKPQGMGMGLAICRSIVEAHGGRLWAAPRVPYGSTFNIELPKAV